MSSVCNTVTVPGAVRTILSTATNPVVTTITPPASQTVITSPVVQTICPTAAPCAGESSCSVDTVCETSTTFELVTSVLPGTAVTSTLLENEVLTVFITDPGTPTTVCGPAGSPITITASPNTTPPRTSPQPTQPPAQNSETALEKTRTAVSVGADGLITSYYFITVETTMEPITTTHIQPKLTETDEYGNTISHLTSWATIVETNPDGQIITRTEGHVYPTVLNEASRSSSKTQNATIIGSVIGGVVGLGLLLCLLWFMRKRGILIGKKDDQFTEDMWKPKDHSGATDDNHVNGDSPHLSAEKALYNQRHSIYSSENHTATFGHDTLNREGSGSSHAHDHLNYPLPPSPPNDRLSHTPSNYGLYSEPGAFEYVVTGDETMDQNLRQSLSLSPSDPALNPNLRHSLTVSSDTKTAATSGSVFSKTNPSPYLPPFVTGHSGIELASSASFSPPQSPRVDVISSPAPLNRHSRSSLTSSTGFPSPSSPNPNDSTLNRTSLLEIPKRPDYERKDSEDSLQYPSQYLGAHIVNGTPETGAGPSTFEH